MIHQLLTQQADTKKITNSNNYPDLPVSHYKEMPTRTEREKSMSHLHNNVKTIDIAFQMSVFFRSHTTLSEQIRLRLTQVLFQMLAAQTQTI